MKIAIISILLIMSSTAVADNYIENPEEGMRIAMLDYQKGRYEDAYKKFKSLAERYALDGHNSSFRFMAAKSLYMGGEYALAILLLDEYLDDFPRSRYAGAALLLKGHALYRSGDLMGSASATFRLSTSIAETAPVRRPKKTSNHWFKKVCQSGN